MTARIAALIRRWKVWRRYSQLDKRLGNSGHKSSRGQDAALRAQAERDVP